jgi:hypothetical protein
LAAVIGGGFSHHASAGDRGGHHPTVLVPELTQSVGVRCAFASQFGAKAIFSVWPSKADCDRR